MAYATRGLRHSRVEEQIANNPLNLWGMDRVDFQERYGDELLAEIEAEHRACYEVHDLLDQAAEIAVRHRMEVIGDGQGGALIREWISAIENYLGDVLIPKIASTKRRGPPPLSTTACLAVFDADGYRCVRCGTREQLTVDHKIPGSKGGTNDPSNLQTLCRPCNTSKGTKVE